MDESRQEGVGRNEGDMVGRVRVLWVRVEYSNWQSANNQDTVYICTYAFIIIRLRTT